MVSNYSKTSDIQDEMFRVRRPIPSEILSLRSLLVPLVTAGDFGDDLTFGDLEIEEYLDWFLPRVLADRKCLFYILEFHPLSSFRSYEPKIIGCFYVRLDGGLLAPPHPRSLAMFKLRAHNALEDFQIWPNKHAAEVHRRFMDELERQAVLRKDRECVGKDGHLCFIVVQRKYRGIGLGSKMLKWAIESAHQSHVSNLDFVGGLRETKFVGKYGFIEQSSCGKGDDTRYSILRLAQD